MPLIIPFLLRVQRDTADMIGDDNKNHDLCCASAGEKFEMGKEEVARKGGLLLGLLVNPNLSIGSSYFSLFLRLSSIYEK